MATALDRAVIMSSLADERPIPVVTEDGERMVVLYGTVMPLRLFHAALADVCDMMTVVTPQEENFVADELFLLWSRHKPTLFVDKESPFKTCRALVVRMMSALKKNDDPRAAFRDLLITFEDDYEQAVIGSETEVSLAA